MAGLANGNWSSDAAVTEQLVLPRILTSWRMLAVGIGLSKESMHEYSSIGR